MIIKVIAYIVLIRAPASKKRRLVFMIARGVALVLWIGLYLPHLMDVASWADSPAAQMTDSVWGKVAGTRMLDLILEILVTTIIQGLLIFCCFKYWK